MADFLQKRFDSRQKYDFLSILAIKSFTYNNEQIQLINATFHKDEKNLCKDVL